MIKEVRFRQTKAPKWSTFFALVAMVARLAPGELPKSRVRLTSGFATYCLWVMKLQENNHMDRAGGSAPHWASEGRVLGVRTFEKNCQTFWVLISSFHLI